MSVIDQLSQIAKSRGGSCLSDTYNGARTKLMWECAKGHQWETAPNNIKAGTWCPDCAGKRKRTIEEMHQLAKDRGGKCLSNNYKDGNTKLLWECSKGHRWEAPSARVRLTGSWCPVCAREARRSSTWLTIKDMQGLASKRGGRCLSEHYKGSREKLLWECSKGHKWEALHGRIQRGEWCPICAGNVKPTIEDMKKVAADRGGECLSDAYINSQTKLQWECSEGHQWEATPNKVKSGGWCPKCFNKTRGDFRKLSIGEMHQIAAERGGRCISAFYTNTRTKLLWECSVGHTWEASPSGIKKGTWCPKCYISPLTKRRQERVD